MDLKIHTLSSNSRTTMVSMHTSWEMISVYVQHATISLILNYSQHITIFESGVIKRLQSAGLNAAAINDTIRVRDPDGHLFVLEDRKPEHNGLTHVRIEIFLSHL
jgi:hypothetical protein